MNTNTRPSEKLHPNRSDEEQDMEMTPVVIGPPGYGSPDERTQAGRLVPLNEHPLSGQLDADYGKDALGEGAEAGTSPDAVADPDEMTVEQLDDKYGDHEGYLKSENKDWKVKFAKKADKSEES